MRGRLLKFRAFFTSLLKNKTQFWCRPAAQWRWQLRGPCWWGGLAAGSPTVRTQPDGTLCVTLGCFPEGPDGACEGGSAPTALISALLPPPHGLA